MKFCFKTLKLGVGIPLILLVVGCGAGGKGPAVNIKISGVIVVPETPVVVSEKIMAKAVTNDEPLGHAVCPDVPEGYSPIPNADISFLDAAGNVVGGGMATDECGRFSGTAPQETISIMAKSEGNRDIVADISVFAPGGSGVASTIPETASYQIASLQQLDANRIGIVVTDNVTNKAVIGIPASAFSVELNGSPVSMTSLSLATLLENSSVALVMDASGSMRRKIFTDPDTGKTFNRNQLAAISAHIFLDQKGENDEVATVIFDNEISFMNQAMLDGSSLQSLVIRDEFFNIVTYPFPVDGFTTDSAQMRFIIDAYNADSQLYGPLKSDPRHEDTPSNLTVDDYKWGGVTALYDGIAEGISRLKLRDNARRFVIALTDGRENSSSSTLDEVIANAKANSVSVYTIGFGSDWVIDKAALERIATETGASFMQVTDKDASLLTSVFQSISTNILFQYTGNLDVDLVSPYTLTLTLDFNGVKVSRDLSN